MRILFLHGWQSVVGGRKPSWLSQQGHQVLNPALPDDDFEACVTIAQSVFDEQQPEIVVGSSRGGAVAMNIQSGSVPLVLLCPAWKHWGKATTVKDACHILHSRHDEVIPFADSEELLTRSGLPAAHLTDTGTEHRLADEASLSAMVAACHQLLD